MPYVGGQFGRDIFLSYSRGGSEDTLGKWSRGFATRLKKELMISLNGSPVEMFIDENPDRNNRLDPTALIAKDLEKKVADSAVLLPLLSDQYLQSEWCSFEREVWNEANDDPLVDVDGRVFPVEIRKIQSESLPSEFADRKGYQLYGANPDRPIGYPNPDHDLLVEAMMGLCGDLKARLDEIRDANLELEAARAEAQRLSQEAGQIVYLHGRTTSAEAWDQAAQKLFDDGFFVVPEEPEELVSDPKKLRQNKNLRVEALTGCDALLMLGANNREIYTDLVVVGKEDRNLAREASQKFLPCAVIDSTDTPAERQRLFRERFDVSWINARIDDWVPDVRTWLASCRAKVLA